MWTYQNWDTIQTAFSESNEIQEENEEIVGSANYMRMNKW